MTDLLTPLSDEFKDIYFFQGQRDGKYPYSHSFIIKDYIIDTGVSSGFLRKLRKQLKINNVILSHWHEDHISGNRFFPEATYYAHSEDMYVIEDIQKMFEYYQVFEYPEQEEMFRSILDAMKIKDTKVHKTISDNETLKIGDDMELKIIHTPGHTKGHCCFYEENSKIAFFSDIDLSSLGPWYGGMDSNVMDFEDSIKKMLNFEIETAVTGHKGIISGKSEVKEKIQNYLDIIYQRDNRILAELSEKVPKTAANLKKKNLIYPRYTDFETYEIIAEQIMIDLHFNKFLKNGIIEESNNRSYILV